MKSLIDKHLKSPKAVIAANVSNMETIIAVFAAATATNSDVILQIAPIQLKVQDVLPTTMVQLIKLIALDFAVDYSIHLDHAESFEECRDAIMAGFDSVMIDASACEYEKNIRVTKEVVDFAKSHGVIVEAELGSFSTKEGESGGDSDRSLFTDPVVVKDFIERTGIDLLAVSIGNTHGFYKGEPKIDLDVLEDINAVSKVPLVLHGSTGIPGSVLRECVKRGIFKVNVFTQLDSSFVNAFADSIKHNEKMMFAQKAGQEAYKNSLIHYMNDIKE